MFKNMRLVILFYMLLNPSFKMTTGFAIVARTTVSTSKFVSCKFEKLNEDPTLKREASLQRFLGKLKQKHSPILVSSVFYAS